MLRKFSSRGSWVVAVGAALLFLPFLATAPLFDWDEINFAEAAREMLVTGEWLRMQVDFKPFWEKPPLFIWMQALSMALFGVNEFAARLPNALCGIATLVVIYNMGALLFRRRFGLLWAMCYAAALVPHLYFRSGIIDPVFNLFIFLSLWYFILYYWRQKAYALPQLKHNRFVYLLLAGVFAGLAVLTKGQAALVILVGAIGAFWLLRNQYLGIWLRGNKLHAILRYRFAELRRYVPIWHLLLALVACVLVTLLWYGTEVVVNGWWFVREFVVYQIRLLSTADAGHAGFPGYHLVMIFFLCFPASIFALRAMWRHQSEELHQQNFRKWMLILFWVVVILFELIKTKIVHYSSMAYLPLSFLAAYTLYYTLAGKLRWRRWQQRLLLGMGVLLGSVLTLLPIVATYWLADLAQLATDPYTRGAMLAEDVHWPFYTLIPGLLLLGSTLWGGRALARGQLSKGFLTILLGSMLSASTVGTWHLHRIAGYSQQAATDFFAQVADQEVYVITLGYKSYAHLFYGQLKQPTHPAYYHKHTESYDEHIAHVRNWLGNGADVDRDVYFCVKLNQKPHIARWFPQLAYLGERNGFAFYKRPKPQAALAE